VQLTDRFRAKVVAEVQKGGMSESITSLCRRVRDVAAEANPSARRDKTFEDGSTSVRSISTGAIESNHRRH